MSKKAIQPTATTNKSLGQHWLYDDACLRAMADAAAVGPEDTILEIGPGLGTLTKHLLRLAESVIAVEFDQKLAIGLDRHLRSDKLRVINQDILRFDLTTLPAGYKVVANIPYYLTSKLVRVLSETPNPPSLVALLIQKEVAERLAARPGQLSILGVTAQYYYQISLDRVVPAELFMPAPKVDSQIVRLERRVEPLFAAENPNGSPFDPKDFFRVVKAGFGAKRKTLLNSLSAGLRLDKAATLALLSTAGIDPGLRAQNLGLEEWYVLYLACSKAL